MTPDQLAIAAVVRSLKQARQAKGWTQDRLAVELACSSNTVYRVEAGRDVRLSTLLKMAAALGVSVHVSAAGQLGRNLNQRG